MVFPFKVPLSFHSTYLLKVPFLAGKTVYFLEIWVMKKTNVEGSSNDTDIIGAVLAVMRFSISKLSQIILLIRVFENLEERVAFENWFSHLYYIPSCRFKRC